MKKIVHIFTVGLVLVSCGTKNSDSIENSINNLENKLIVTQRGDSLEIGYWKYNNEISKISKSGYYENGYKVREWNYENLDDSILVFWEIYERDNVKFNYFQNLQILDSPDFPLLFLGDIVDDDKNTYVALLEYDLEGMGSSIYDYLYQVNQNREQSLVEIIKVKRVRKFFFKNVEIFKFHVQVERESKMYEVISYIFEVNGLLYDLSYKNILSKTGSLDYELFNDMLYSMNCQGKDIFTNSTGKFYKEEGVNFE